MGAGSQAARFQRLLGYLAQDTGNLHLLGEAASCAIGHGQWQQAGQLVARALELHPDNTLARYHRAVLLARAGQSEESLAITQDLVKAGHHKDEILFQHACNLVIAGRHREAEPILSSLQPRIGHLAGFAWFHLRALHAVGKLDEAERTALALGEDVAARGMLSLVLIDADQLERGRALAQAVLARAPHNIDALLAEGTAALAYEEHAAALLSFEQATSRQPRNGRAWLGLGLAQLLAQDFVAAYDGLEKAVRFMPAHPGAWNALAWLQLLQNELDAAERSLHSALAIDRNFAESHGTLAVLSLLRQDWRAAEHEVEIALRLQPQCFAASFARSLLLEHLGQSETARQVVWQVQENLQRRTGRRLSDTLRRYLSPRPNTALPRPKGPERSQA